MKLCRRLQFSKSKPCPNARSTATSNRTFNSSSRLSYVAINEYAGEDKPWTNVDWASLAIALQSDDALSDFSVLAAISKDFSTGCILHEAIATGIPDKIVVLLAQRCPAFVSQLDSNGRFPIHVACFLGSSSEFVSHCIDINPTSSIAEDIDGNTPIQLLCKGRWKGNWDKSNPAADMNMVDILSMLYRDVPSSILQVDSCGMCPIEIAIRSNLGLKFIQILQHMTVVTCRQLKGDDTQASHLTILTTKFEEIESRNRRVEQVEIRKQRDTFDENLYDLFGIEGQSRKAAETRRANVSGQKGPAKSSCCGKVRGFARAA
ncbi:hypothetical protein ACHAWF_012039 [Thalassiosira exigua]